MRRAHPALLARQAGDADLQAVKEEVDDRRGEERQGLGDDEPADDGDAERAAELRAGPSTESERQAAEQGGHGGHHDGTEAEEAGFEDGFFGGLAVFSLGDKGEVDHHNGVLFDDTDEQDDPDHRDDRKIDLE